VNNLLLYKVLNYISNNPMCSIKDIRKDNPDSSLRQIYRIVDICFINALIHQRVNHNVKKYIIIDKGVETMNILHDLNQLVAL